MRYLISIDDTDDLTKETSTGRIAGLIAKHFKKDYHLKVHQGVTRHQLLLKEGIPYTSHNSAMCIDVEGDMEMDQIISESMQMVYDNMASTACPGICVCCTDHLDSPDELIHFGINTQQELMFKEQAHDMIDKYDCLFGKELGGNGQGIIGAVAGIGLRLSGNDGTFRGKIKFEDGCDHMLAGELKKQQKIDEIREMNTQENISDTAVIYINEFSKTFLRDKKRIAYVTEKADGTYELCEREKALSFKSVCEHFVLDNDSNECLSDEERCENCLYRRLTENGFMCDRK